MWLLICRQRTTDTTVVKLNIAEKASAGWTRRRLTVARLLSWPRQHISVAHAEWNERRSVPRGKRHLLAYAGQRRRSVVIESGWRRRHCTESVTSTTSTGHRPRIIRWEPRPTVRLRVAWTAIGRETRITGLSPRNKYDRVIGRNWRGEHLPAVTQVNSDAGLSETESKRRTAQRCRLMREFSSKFCFCLVFSVSCYISLTYTQLYLNSSIWCHLIFWCLCSTIFTSNFPHWFSMSL